MSEAIVYQQSPVSSGSIPDSPAATTLSGDGNSVSSIGESLTDNVLTKVQSEPIKPSYIPKTDKPRPHVCNTCQRSFARLEHLKRHERSHTKEKPFECPQCTRCFARRDLLLRHQQKLHLTDTPSVKSSKGRRDSLNSVASGKIRKNSATAALGGAGARPRANTTGHVDGRTLGIMQGMNRHINNQNEGVDYTQFINAGQSHANMQAMQASGPNGLRLATNGLHNMSHAEGSLRTAPAVAGFNGNFTFSPMHAGGSTVNPAQLHMGEGQHQGGFGAMDTGAIEDDDAFDWMRSFQNRYPNSNDQALQSSPSMMSHASDLNMHGHDNFNQPSNEAMMWQRHASMSGPYPDHSVSIPQDMMHINPSAPQFGYMQDRQQMDHMYRTPPQNHAISPNAVNGFSPQLPHQMVYGSDGSNSVSSISMNGSTGRHSSVTSISTDTITDVTRSALLKSLAQSQQLSHGGRKFSQPAVSSPLRETFRGQIASGGLPSTQDLQRFVGAYIQYFHPHFPFLHIGTLSFDTPAYTNQLRPALSPSPGSGRDQPQLIGGGGCLVLAMAAIGALYEQDQPASRELFVAAKKMIQLYLEERRKVDAKTPKDQANTNTTPLWLVQAMLLNVIYGHNCSDKISGDIAETHCAALIKLASSAGLLSPLAESNIGKQYFNDGHRLSPIHETPGHEPTLHNNPFGMGIPIPDENHQWHRWVAMEERKRALYAIFHMSSLLVASYNHPPALMNSAVEHDLPCEESLWNAENASAWMALGGTQFAQQNSISFANALSMLLNASRTEVDYRRLSQQQTFGSGVPMHDLPPSPLKPSTFGCLVLIDALHNYIWETRQRHTGRQWTTQETESMHAHIEPALRAWQAAWAANPMHSLERPNPHGVGPLSADCIPLLDLAYVRLFVSFGAAKEAFWSRDFDAMSEELARGSEFIQHADHSEGNTAVNTAQGSRNSPEPVTMSNGPHQMGPDGNNSQYSKRERQLRKAAFYAADSLSMANKLGVTFADFTSRELPLQAGLCTFDCAQILAEWVSTVQERVGRYIGVLGRDNIDFGNVPAIMVLEGEDINLLQKIDEILRRAEAKMTVAMNGLQGSVAMLQMQKLPSNSNKGFGSKILTVTAHMFERNEIWPVFHTMAEGLDCQAEHMSRRAENSTRQSGQVN